MITGSAMALYKSTRFFHDQNISNIWERPRKDAEIEKKQEDEEEEEEENTPNSFSFSFLFALF